MINCKKSILNRTTAYLLAFMLMLSCFSTIAYADSKSDIAGYVTISFEDTVDRLEDCDIDKPIGNIIKDTVIEFYEGDTVSDVTYRLLDKLGIGYSGSESYLSSIKDFTVNDVHYQELGDSTCGSMSGWLVAYNNRFGDKSIDCLYVEDGDYIDWKYTCEWGCDIGNDWSKESAKITGITIDSNYGTISPEFSQDIKEYTLTVGKDVNSVKLVAELENYSSVVTYSVDNTEYKYLQDIPVQNDTVINIKSIYNSYNGNNDEDNIKVTVVKEVSSVENKPDSSNISNNTDNSKNTIYIIFISIGILLFVAIVGFIIYYKILKNRRKK